MNGAGQENLGMCLSKMLPIVNVLLMERRLGTGRCLPLQIFLCKVFSTKYQILLYRPPIYSLYILDVSQVTVTCSNITTETLEKGPGT